MKINQVATSSFVMLLLTLLRQAHAKAHEAYWQLSGKNSFYAFLGYIYLAEDSINRFAGEDNGKFTTLVGDFTKHFPQLGMSDTLIKEPPITLIPNITNGITQVYPSKENIWAASISFYNQTNHTAALALDTQVRDYYATIIEKIVTNIYQRWFETAHTLGFAMGLISIPALLLYHEYRESKDNPNYQKNVCMLKGRTSLLYLSSLALANLIFYEITSQVIHNYVRTNPSSKNLGGVGFGIFCATCSLNVLVKVSLDFIVNHNKYLKHDTAAKKEETPGDCSCIKYSW